jgi:hypothetical protein
VPKGHPIGEVVTTWYRSTAEAVGKVYLEYLDNRDDYDLLQSYVIIRQSGWAL